MSMMPETSDLHSVRLHLAAQILREHGEIRLGVSGSSMLPAIFPGEVVTINRAGADEIRPGDILLRKHGPRVILHRAIRRIGAADQWITRGDALADLDPPARNAEILGRVTAIERFGRSRCPMQITTVGTVLAFTLRRSAAARFALLRWHALRRRFRARLAPARSAAAKPAAAFPIARERA